MTRIDQRTPDQLRSTAIQPQYLLHPEGSVLIAAGQTRVICTASVEDRVPSFLRNTGKGWVTDHHRLGFELERIADEPVPVSVRGYHLQRKRVRPIMRPRKSDDVECGRADRARAAEHGEPPRQHGSEVRTGLHVPIPAHEGLLFQGLKPAK